MNTSIFSLTTHNTDVRIELDVSNFTKEYLENFAKDFYNLNFRRHLVQLAYSALRTKFYRTVLGEKAHFEGYGSVDITNKGVFIVRVSDGEKDLFNVKVQIMYMSPTVDLDDYDGDNVTVELVEY